MIRFQCSMNLPSFFVACLCSDCFSSTEVDGKLKKMRCSRSFYIVVIQRVNHAKKISTNSRSSTRPKMVIMFNEMVFSRLFHCLFRIFSAVKCRAACSLMLPIWSFSFVKGLYPVLERWRSSCIDITCARWRRGTALHSSRSFPSVP